jgi:hypothetical protein
LVHVVDHLLLLLLKHLVVQHLLIIDHLLKVVLILLPSNLEPCRHSQTCRSQAKVHRRWSRRRGPTADRE